MRLSEFRCRGSLSEQHLDCEEGPIPVDILTFQRPLQECLAQSHRLRLNSLTLPMSYELERLCLLARNDGLQRKDGKMSMSVKSTSVGAFVLQNLGTNTTEFRFPTCSPEYLSRARIEILAVLEGTDGQ